MSSGNRPALLALAASIVAIFALRITHGTFNPHSECRLSSETSPSQPLLTALVTMITHSSRIRSAGCCTLTTTAGRSRKRGTSTNGKGTQTTSPARNCASVMIERLAISLACPFGKAAEIPHKRVSLGVCAGHDDMITIDFPHHLVTWLQAKRAAYRTRNGGLRLRSDFTEDHDRNVRIILTSGNDQSHRLPSGIYCVGWARRGPSDTIGTNRPDGFGVIEKIAEDIDSGALGRPDKPGRAGFDALASERALDIVTFRDWKKIEEAEEAAAREGAPREKFVDIAAMIKARG